ncbi:MAG: hypothetical protein ACJ79S_07365 [Gemmatimonadaceae bacterium]
MSPPEPSSETRRCSRCGRALAPHEEQCEGCSLAEAMGPRGARRYGRAALVLGVVAATLEMAALLWFLFR